MLSVAWIGQLFLDALKMMIVPLIVAAVISGVATLESAGNLGKLGGIAVGYYAATTALAVMTGLVLVNLIEPGLDAAANGLSVPENVAAKTGTGVTDIIRELIHPNIIAAAAETRLLPLIVFSMAFGVALLTVGEPGRPVIAFINGINEAMMRLVIWLMYLAPIGVFALVAAKFGEAGGGAAFWAQVRQIGAYVFTVLLGLGIHSIVLLAILLLVTGRGGAYILGMARALLTAFGTASSSATLPLTMECARENGIDPRAVRFVLPLGATVNMDGTALYEAVAVMFIAQAYGVDFGFGEQALVFITATLAAVGAAGIPQAGLVTMVIVLTTVNLPLEGISLLLAVDWFLDRFRTTVNVWGDSVGAAVVERIALTNHRTN